MPVLLHRSSVLEPRQPIETVAKGLRMLVLGLQPIETVLSAAVGGFVVVCAAVLRVYLGYSYVGNRLLTASLEYEETGWCVCFCSCILAGSHSISGALKKLSMQFHIWRFFFGVYLSC